MEGRGCLCDLSKSCSCRIALLLLIPREWDNINIKNYIADLVAILLQWRGVLIPSWSFGLYSALKALGKKGVHSS